MILELGKEYRLTSGAKVKIVSLSSSYTYMGNNYPCIGELDRCCSPLHFLPNGIGVGHILEEIPLYEDFKMDEPVLVRDSEDDSWRHRFFKRVDKNGRAITWVNGTSSWFYRPASVIENGEMSETDWKFCRRPTQEELGK